MLIFKYLMKYEEYQLEQKWYRFVVMPMIILMISLLLEGKETFFLG